jgi:hypothetical protein
VLEKEIRTRFCEQRATFRLKCFHSFRETQEKVDSQLQSAQAVCGQLQKFTVIVTRMGDLEEGFWFG